MGAVAAADGWLANGIWMYVHRWWWWWWWDAMRCDDAEGYLNNNRKRKVVAFVRTSFLTARSFLLNMHVNFYSKHLFFNSSFFIFCSPRISSIIDKILHTIFFSWRGSLMVCSCCVCKTSELSSQSHRLRDFFLCGCHIRDQHRTETGSWSISSRLYEKSFEFVSRRFAISRRNKLKLTALRSLSISYLRFSDTQVLSPYGCSVQVIADLC